MAAAAANSFIFRLESLNNEGTTTATATTATTATEATCHISLNELKTLLVIRSCSISRPKATKAIQSAARKGGGAAVSVCMCACVCVVKTTDSTTKINNSHKTHNDSQSAKKPRNELTRAV